MHTDEYVEDLIHVPAIPLINVQINVPAFACKQML